MEVAEVVAEVEVVVVARTAITAAHVCKRNASHCLRIDTASSS